MIVTGEGMYVVCMNIVDDLFMIDCRVVTACRVLHMDTSPDGSTVVSAAADETLRFWDMFGSPPHAKGHCKGMEQGVPGSLSSMHSLR